jgi:hypothetical protein
MPIIVPPYSTSRSLYSSFSARIRLESQVALGASLILYAFESVFYCVLVRTTVYKRNICIETGTYDSLVFLGLGFIAWIILPPYRGHQNIPGAKVLPESFFPGAKTIP